MEMSVTRALAELKLLDSRIEKTSQSLSSITYVTGKKVVNGYKSNEEYSDRVKSIYQSINNLIKRRTNIKTAIVKSNAETVVTIGSKSMTIAEAIERKTSIIYDQNLLAKLKSDYAKTLQLFENEQERVKVRLDDYLKNTLGGDKKTNKGEQEEESKVFMERNEPKLIDPLNIKNEIDKLELEINEFLLNVDFVLSESNSLTKIEIPE